MKLELTKCFVAIAVVCLLAGVAAWGEASTVASPAEMAAPGGPNIVAGDTVVPERGVYEVRLTAEGSIASPYLGTSLAVTFTRPDAIRVTVEGFYDGHVNGKPVYKARAYCDRVGAWSWASASAASGLDGRSGTFTVAASALPGKLRKHAKDPQQFAYDNGEWFLHIGDTGYRYVVDTEPEWQAYLDQAVAMGATKIRTWFCRSRSGVEALFTPDRSALNLAYWQEIDRRVQYALNKHPQIILQLIPYGEDGQELKRYAAGDAMSRFVARYAQARWSALPNILWCISNDQKLVAEGTVADGAHIQASIIDAIGQDMDAREPWGTLLTNHQARYSGYAFTAAPWSDITTFEDLDEVAGALLIEYREKADDPVVNEEDRYEMHERPEHPPYYFRRLMWASLLSGGHATYGGSRTYEEYDGKERGVRGYFDLNREGLLRGGADGFKHIHTFFKESGITLAGMRPADAMAGSDARVAKAIADERTIIVYLANPNAEEPKQTNAAESQATCELRLPLGSWMMRWFNPSTGNWTDISEAQGKDSPLRLIAPFVGDAVWMAQRPGR